MSVVGTSQFPSAVFICIIIFFGSSLGWAGLDGWRGHAEFFCDGLTPILCCRPTATESQHVTQIKLTLRLHRCRFRYPQDRHCRCPKPRRRCCTLLPCHCPPSIVENPNLSSFTKTTPPCLHGSQDARTPVYPRFSRLCSTEYNADLISFSI